MVVETVSSEIIKPYLMKSIHFFVKFLVIFGQRDTEKRSAEYIFSADGSIIFER